jgi:peptide deformylase
MTLRKIALLGHPVLLEPARPVADPTAADVRELIRDMTETLADARGLGLAAPQVYSGMRVLLALEPLEDAVDRAADPLVLVNPVLTPLGDRRDAAFEGCLSIPGLRGLVPRHHEVGLAAIDAKGRPVEREAKGLFARILQHEVDHLDGVLYLDRLTSPRHLAFDSELARLSAYLDEPTVAGRPATDARRRSDS